MILYKNTASAFCNAVDDNHIVDDLENAFLTQVGHGVSPNEKNSWNNSLQFMERVIRKSAIPADSGILLEYNIPATSKRIDVVVSGHDEKERKNFVIIVERSRSNGYGLFGSYVCWWRQTSASASCLSSLFLQAISEGYEYSGCGFNSESVFLCLFTQLS